MENNDKTHLTEIAEGAWELFEVVADNALLVDGSLVKDLPIVGMVVSGLNIYQKIKAQAFEKKIIAFMREIGTEHISAFKDAIKKKGNDELGEEIINTLDKVDKAEQAKMIARATKKYIGGSEQASKLIFDHDMHAIRNLDSYLLSGIESIYGNSDLKRVHSVDQALFNLGLVDQEEKPSFTSKTEPLISFIASDRGKDFYQGIVLGNIT